jgi:hypothetical protein
MRHVDLKHNSLLLGRFTLSLCVCVFQIYTMRHVDMKRNTLLLGKFDYPQFLLLRCWSIRQSCWLAQSLQTATSGKESIISNRAEVSSAECAPALALLQAYKGDFSFLASPPVIVLAQ